MITKFHAHRQPADVDCVISSTLVTLSYTQSVWNHGISPKYTWIPIFNFIDSHPLKPSSKFSHGFHTRKLIIQSSVFLHKWMHLLTMTLDNQGVFVSITCVRVSSLSISDAFKVHNLWKYVESDPLRHFKGQIKYIYNTILWTLLTFYLRNEYNSLATKAANGKRCNHDKEKASQINVVRKWVKCGLDRSFAWKWTVGNDSEVLEDRPFSSKKFV